ncbi:MAG: hypothetical protein NT070_06125 [Cyanobacteria bacterium]|nr:hypothetical protein [Cyanobacteriota bacterium]
MPSFPQFLTLAAILSLVFPKASPGKATEWAERGALNLFYAVAGWAMLGAPNLHKAKVSMPDISLPKTEQSTFTTAKTTTPLTTAVTTPAQTTGVLVRCPTSIQVVNIRQNAGLAAVATQVNCGDRVIVRGSDRPMMNGETWVPVQSKGVNGWATARYLVL